MIEIALCTDNNYVMPAGVMIYSVCKHTPDVSFNVIIPDDFEGDNKCRLKEITDSFNMGIRFIVISKDVVDGFPVGLRNQPEHITKAAYYRLFLGRLLPAEVNRVIYLDCDLICNSSLDELWDIDLNDAPLACVAEVQRYWQHPQQRLGYDVSYPYFNSGVLLINLDYWRRNNVENQFVHFLENYREKILFHDQDVLNWAFHRNALFLPPKFNASDFFFHKEFTDRDNRFSSEQIEEARRHPVIVHFTYKHKPWIKGGSHTYGKKFLEYKRNTPWKRQCLSLRKSDNFKGKVADFLVLLGLYRYHDDYISL